MIKKIISISLLVLFFLTISTDVDAQRKKRKTSKKTEETEDTRSRSRSRSSSERTETVSFTDNLTYDINIGNISFNNGFGITLKPAVGYKIIDRVSAGLALRTFYNFRNVRGGDDFSTLSYGPALYSRFKISEEFYVQGEYMRMSYQFDPNADRLTESSPLAGIGYLSGFGPWKFGIQVLFVFNEQVRDIENTIDYWFSFAYNF